MKFYFVAWYDPSDHQVHPIHGSSASEIALTYEEGEQVPLFTYLVEALDYYHQAQEMPLADGERYLIGLFDGDTGEWEEVEGT